jgi:hypothetical protein
MPKRVSSKLTVPPSKANYFLSQVVIAHKTEVNVYSLIVKQKPKGSSLSLDVKLHIIYNIKTANVRVDFLTLIDHGSLFNRCDRYHVASSKSYSGQESSIVSSWDIHMITSSKDGFVG